ncbi:MAG: ribosome maturation factor RimP [Actinomycetota bacterium]|nr:ribosome maturation factor RimP [Actinomycetota bacterium]
MNREPRIEKIEKLIEPIAEREGLEIVDIELKREAIGLVLRIYLDAREGKVNLDTLAKASELIGSILDKEDVIRQKYTLEVSSPGIERPLTKPEHFKRFVGSKVLVKTKNPIEGRKKFKGLLAEAGDESFVIETNSEGYKISYSNVAKARLHVEIEF